MVKIIDAEPEYYYSIESKDIDITELISKNFVSMKFEERYNSPSIAMLKIEDPLFPSKASWIESPFFREGTLMILKMGYNSNGILYTKVFSGFITDLYPDFEESVYLNIVLTDPLCLFDEASDIAQYKNMSVKKIVEKIFENLGFYAAAAIEIEPELDSAMPDQDIKSNTGDTLLKWLYEEIAERYGCILYYQPDDKGRLFHLVKRETKMKVEKDKPLIWFDYHAGVGRDRLEMAIPVEAVKVSYSRRQINEDVGTFHHDQEEKEMTIEQGETENDMPADAKDSDVVVKEYDVIIGEESRELEMSDGTESTGEMWRDKFRMNKTGFLPKQ